MGKVINRIPGSRLLISSLPDLALRRHVEQAFSKPCLVNLISKDAHLVFFMYGAGLEVLSLVWVCIHIHTFNKPEP